VLYPLGSYTKAQALGSYIARGNDPQELIAHTRSCYENTRLPCGVCSACVKRHIALRVHGLTERTVADPDTSGYLADIVQRWHTYDTLRRQETLQAFPQLAAQVPA